MLSICRDGRTVVEGVSDWSLQKSQQPITNNLLKEKNVWMIEIDEEVFHHPINVPSPRGMISYSDDWRPYGNAVLSEAIRNLDATVSF